MSVPLLDRYQATVLLVDVQEKLLPLMPEATDIVAACTRVLDMAHVLKMPVWVSEQYPKGLGLTPALLRGHPVCERILEKTYFSAARDPATAPLFSNEPKKQWVVCGIETHVCVLQTVLDLCALNKEVFVLADACLGRHATDHALALDRMRQAGAFIISSEMMMFEALRDSRDPDFKVLSRRFLTEDKV